MKIAFTALTMVGLVGIAAAQPKVDAKVDTKLGMKAGTKADAKVDAKAGAQMEAPKPPAEIAALAKIAVGTWRCTGTEISMDGTSGKMTATVKTKLDLDKWWITETMEARGARGAFKMVAYTTYDPSSKKWRRVSIDNMGSQYVGTSDGLKDNKLEWNMDFMGSMGAGMFRDQMDMTDAKAGAKLSGEISMDKGKSWKPVYAMTCKK